jgi:hypothetical protein
MFTDDQMNALVQARSLHIYTLTDGKGYHLTWTEAGSAIPLWNSCFESPTALKPTSRP